MQLIIIFLTIIYVIIYTSPELVIGYSWFIPTVLAMYVLINCLYLWKYKRRQLFCFEFFFAISFFLCCFLTPLIYEYLDKYHQSFFQISEISIVRVCLISIIGYLFYLIGLCIKNEKLKNNVFRYNVNAVNLSNRICFSLIILFYVLGGLQLIYIYNADVSGGEGRFHGWGFALFFAMYAYIVSILINFSSVNISRASTWNFINSLPILFKINTGFLLIPLLLSGLRSSTLQLIIPLLLMYSISVKRISAKMMTIILLAGVVIMVFIGFNRTEGGNVFQQDNGVNYLRDFFYANSSELYLIDYADKYGATGGGNMLMPILSIIPFLQSFTAQFIDINQLPPVSSVLYTDAYNTGSGLGTNLIGDLYYSFGFLGVIVLMFIYGVFLKRCNSFKTPYGLVLLLAFSGNALFAPRVEFAYIIRSLSYCVLILYIINHSCKKTYTVVS